MTTRSYSSASTHRAKLLFVNAVVDTGIQPMTAAFQMKHLGLTSKDIIRMKRKGKLA
jgi:hypothetical protein